MADKIWPDTPFDELMLGQDVIIHCPDKELVEELFDMFRNNGVYWMTMTSMDRTYWGENGAKTCYRVRKDRGMNYGDTTCYLNGDYENYIKCTFYGIDTKVADDISDDGFLALLGIGGD